MKKFPQPPFKFDFLMTPPANIFMTPLYLKRAHLLHFNICDSESESDLVKPRRHEIGRKFWRVQLLHFFATTSLVDIYRKKRKEKLIM